MQSYNPAIPGALSQDYWMVAKHVHKKYAGKPRVLAINALLHSLVTLAAIIMQNHRQSEFCANLMYHESDPARRVTPPWTFRAVIKGRNP